MTDKEVIRLLKKFNKRSDSGDYENFFNQVWETEESFRNRMYKEIKHNENVTFIKVN